MKAWHRYAVCTLVGLLAGLAAAFALTGGGLRNGTITNGAWSTSLGYGTKATDPLTRALVARAGLLALPSSETLYWSATSDASGAALDGDCRYSLVGKPLDTRWWSVTLYDVDGYLVDNPHKLWSVNGADIGRGADGMWRVRISPDKPQDGAWLPAPEGQDFHLTLRLYNPGATLRSDPAAADLPRITREGCS